MAGKYHTYPEYKATETDWLGQAPLHWMTIPVGRLFRRIKRTGYTERELLSVYRDYGVIPKSSREDNFNKPSEDLNPYQLVKENDLVMNKMKTWQGSIAISEYEGIVSPAYFVYQPLPKLFEMAHPKYVHYLLRNPMYIAQYLRRSKGIRVNQWDLDPDEFQRIELLLPEKDEQLKIFQFLDHETAKIDTLIEKQQQLIKLLKEKRQAVISHAVTKGLNPNAPMRDSGVEWLGEVPVHWRVLKIKHLLLSVKGAIKTGPFGSHLKGEDMQGGEVKVINQRNVIDNDFDCGDYFVSKDKYRELIAFRVFSEDILVTTRGTIGRTAIAPSSISDSILHPCLMRLQVDKAEYCNELVSLIIQDANYFLEQLKVLSNATTIDVIYSENLKNVVITLPSDLSEQVQILNYVREEVDKFNGLIGKSQTAISLMRERRTALISAAVTGKIDVRDWRAPEQSQTSKDVAA